MLSAPGKQEIFAANFANERKWTERVRRHRAIPAHRLTVHGLGMCPLRCPPLPRFAGEVETRSGEGEGSPSPRDTLPRTARASAPPKQEIFAANFANRRKCTERVRRHRAIPAHRLTVHRLGLRPLRCPPLPRFAGEVETRSGEGEGSPSPRVSPPGPLVRPHHPSKKFLPRISQIDANAPSVCAATGPSPRTASRSIGLVCALSGVHLSRALRERSRRAAARVRARPAPGFSPRTARASAPPKQEIFAANFAN